MREQLRVVLAVARDPVLARIELAYFGFNMAEYATWMAILVYAYGLGGAGEAALFALIALVSSGIVAPFAAVAGDRFYVVAEGRAAVTLNGVVIAEPGPGEHFGEIALLRDVPRTATITALTPMRLVAIERDRFLEAVTGHRQSRERALAVASERLGRSPRVRDLTP